MGFILRLLEKMFLSELPRVIRFALVLFLLLLANFYFFDYNLDDLTLATMTILMPR